LLLTENVLIEWEPSNLAAVFFPDHVQQGVSDYFPSPSRLTCYSNTLRAWKVVAESENIDINQNFLLVSSDQNYIIRYVLFVENENKQARTVKNRGTLVEVNEFLPKPIQINVYPVILGGELEGKPAGYYTGKIRACFIDN